MVPPHPLALLLGREVVPVAPAPPVEELSAAVGGGVVVPAQEVAAARADLMKIRIRYRLENLEH